MEASVNGIRSTAALADFYELFRVAFAFPTYDFAQSLASGTFAADFGAIAGELGCAASFDDEALRGRDVELLFNELKREYSWMYLSPGKLRRIYPYESAFLFDRSGERGMPAMIVTRAATDVEYFMRRAGVLPDDYAQEPVDRIDKEFAVMREALVNQMAASGGGEEGIANDWASLASDFRIRHINTWVREFMQRTIEVSRHESYRALAAAFLSIYGVRAAKCPETSKPPVTECMATE